MSMMTGRSRILGATLRAVIAVILLCAARELSATTVAVQDAAGDPGSPVEICVNMTGSGGTVAGVQMDMSWDTNCLNATKGSGDSAACFANPQTGKDVHTKVSNNSMKALFLSVSDLAPIPDTWLFCCAFDIPSSVTTSPCRINLTNVIGSDAGGKEVEMSPRGGSLTINETSRKSQAPSQRGSGVAPPAVSAPGAAPAGQAPAQAPVRGAVAGGTGARAPEAQRGAAGDQMPERLEEATPPEPTQPPGMPAGTRSPHGTVTPQRTPAAAGTPTPQLRATTTTPVMVTATPEQSATVAAPTETPKRKSKKGKKKGS